MPHRVGFLVVIVATVIVVAVVGANLAAHRDLGIAAEKDLGRVESTGMATSTAPSSPFVRVSVSSAGQQADGESFSPSLSADGRFIALASWAANLVDGDTNGQLDVFVHDLLSGQTTRVSIGGDGQEANGGSVSPAISGDGRWVAFSSGASNLVEGDSGFSNDIFLHDRETGETMRLTEGVMHVSVANSVAPTPHPPHYTFRREITINADGRYVAYSSGRPDLVDLDTNTVEDVFVYDRASGVVERVSVSSDGAEANGLSASPSISGDGRFVAFTSLASNLVPGDTNGHFDVFVRDRQTGTTVRVSVDDAGAEADGPSTDPDISADGQVVVYWSSATNLDEDPPFAGPTDIFVHDLSTGSTQRLGAAGEYQAAFPSVSDDGRVVVFQAAEDPTLSPGPLRFNVFAYDRDHHVTIPITLRDGAASEGSSQFADVSGDGRYVVFQSSVATLVTDDTNEKADIFVLDLGSEDGQPKGDVDCDGDVDAVDALYILRHVAALPMNLPQGCAAIGDEYSTLTQTRSLQTTHTTRRIRSNQ